MAEKTTLNRFPLFGLFCCRAALRMRKSQAQAELLGYSMALLYAILKSQAERRREGRHRLDQVMRLATMRLRAVKKGGDFFRSGLTNYVQMKYDMYATQLAIAKGRQSIQDDGLWLKDANSSFSQGNAGVLPGSKDGLGQGNRHPFEQRMWKTNPICRREIVDKFFYEEELRKGCLEGSLGNEPNSRRAARHRYNMPSWASGSV